MDLEDVNVDELGEGETSEDEMGAKDDLGNGGEVGRDRQFFEEGEVQAGDIQEELMEAQEDLGNEDGFGGDREQEEEEQPRRFGWREVGHYWMMPGSDSDEMFRYIHLVHTCLG